MSMYQATLLKTLKHLHVRNGCFRSAGLARPAAPPEGSYEPFPDLILRGSIPNEAQRVAVGHRHEPNGRPLKS